MQRFIAFLSITSRDGLRCYEEYTGWNGFGDWLALDGSDGREGGTSKELIGTAFFAYSSHLLARIAAFWEGMRMQTSMKNCPCKSGKPSSNVLFFRMAP